MRKSSLVISAAAAILGTASLTVPAAMADGGRPATHPSHAPSAAPAQARLAAGVQQHSMCSGAAPGQVRCFGITLRNAQGDNVNRAGQRLTAASDPVAAHGANGFGPKEMQEAYNLKGASSGGRTVAIVDAFGYKGAEKDLATYRKKYGLPECTVASGCLKILNQDGQTTNLPKDDDGWGEEQALDLDAVSATCPDCKLVLVQANSAKEEDIGKAEVTASKQPGVAAISNSFGGDDLPDDKYGKDYNHPNIAVTASTGDDGYKGGSFPANSQYVTAVGGTTLQQGGGQRGWSEAVWSGAGSGCSKTNKIIQGQDPKVTGCQNRAMADVAADADPASGLAMYYGKAGGWTVAGGTSLSAPLVAGMYALSGNTQGMANSIPYSHKDQFNDVTEGSNGTCEHWCKAQKGWDGPTGLGSPNGVKGL